MTDHGIQKFCHFIIFPRGIPTATLRNVKKYVYISSTPFPELAFTCRHVTLRRGWSLLRDNTHGFTQTGQKASNFFVFQPQPQPQTKYYARDDVLIATTIKISIFWDVTPCSLISGYQHFEGTWLFPS